MYPTFEDITILATGCCIAISCALIGSFLMLRKMALAGDAISHAVLPGIVVAFLLSGSRSPLFMIAGASALGLLTTFGMEWLHKKARLQNDAAIGLTFTFLFAVGIIMLSAWAGKVDLDQECVLYGELAYAPLDVWITPSGTVLGPRSLYITGVLCTLVLVIIIRAYRPLMLTTFDPAFASAIGISTSFYHYLLMGLVSVTTVVSFELVGAILVVALLIAPAATAYLLTNSLRTMLILACFFGTAAVAAGYALATALDVSIAGSIATVNGLWFVAAFLFSPAHGLLLGKKRKLQVH
jgi:manganese/zinc/iron transport system permease protein